jgi:hypothetical protein
MAYKTSKARSYSGHTIVIPHQELLQKIGVSGAVLELQPLFSQYQFGIPYLISDQLHQELRL